MRRLELKVQSKYSRFVIASPTHESYGLGISVLDAEIETVVVFGEFEARHAVNVITNMDELPMEFIQWYSSILVNMKTVNQKQLDGEQQAIEPSEIASLNGGIYDYSLVNTEE